MAALVELFYKSALVILGLCFGSFTTVFASRYPRGESLWRPGSHCPLCHSPIKVYYNVPVWGWLILRGRCSECRAKISARYPLMELSFAAVAIVMLFRFGLEPVALYYLGFVWVLLLISWVDWESSYIYDVISLPLLAVGLSSAYWWPEIFSTWWLPIAGSALMFGVMEGSYQLVRLFTGREALGGGDVKLMAAAGAFLGPWGALRAVVLVSILSPLYWMFVRRVKRLGPHEAFPFGPVLAAGCVLSAWELLSGDMGRLMRLWGWDTLAQSLFF